MSLDEAHVMLTGATGFVGQALLERLLSSYPDCRVSVLVRPRGGATAQERLMGMLGKSVFDPLRRDLGDAGLASMVRRRVTVIPGDLTTAYDVPADLDTVLHTAANVSFDAPVDEVFVDNVGGPMKLYRSLLDGAADPHVVHVSTSYVSARRKGVAEEAALVHTVDYEAELGHALDARARAEALSRQPETLETLVRKAERDHGRAGERAVAEAVEAARRDWVRRRLVDHGRTLAQSLGWTDSYTLTKALGERVAERTWAAGGHRLSVVRPTIVESALNHPFPGWIDGFKVADPIIAAYARGASIFAAGADTVIDIIPVDFVVNAILAAAANAPDPNDVKYFQVCSGMTNPLRFGRLAVLTNEYFTAHPLPDAGPPAALGSLPEPRSLDRAMHRRERAVALADCVVAKLPSTARTRKWNTDVLKTRRELDLLRRLMTMYRPYAQCEAIFDDAEARRLNRELPPAPGLAGFDVNDIDWHHYLHDIHLPQIPGLMDRATARSDERPDELPLRDDVLAVFDLHSVVAQTPLWGRQLWAELVRRVLMHRYAGCAEHELRRVVARTTAPALRRRLVARAAEQIEAHRQAGHRTVLVTGQVDMFVEPLAPLFDEVVADSSHIDREGRWTGQLAVTPMVSEARANWLRRYARAQGMDLACSYGYGERYTDRPWLEAVGHPNAVNPDLTRHRHARLRRWPVHSWGDALERRAVPASAAFDEIPARLS